MHNQPTQQEGAEQSQETAYVKPSEHEGKFGIGDKMTFYVDGKPIEAEVVQTEDVDGVVVQTSERVNGHLINQYTREELDALTTPPQQANDNADVARPQAPEAGTEVQNETEEEKSPDELPAFDGDKFNETHPVDEIRQPQEEQKPNEGNNAVDEASTASKIPQGEDGEYDYMQAEPSKAWAALLEQTDGDADMAREVAQSMLDDKVAELEEAQKQQPKEGKSVAEKIAARKEHKANIERIESEIERWRQIIQSGEDRQAGEKSRIDEADETPAVDTKSESGVDGEVKSEDMLQPIGKGVFGNIYDQFKGKVKEAFDFLTKHKSGDLLGVFHRDGFGDIDLVWGDNGGGLAHIIQRHVEEQNDFNSVEEVRDVIDDVIKNGSINEKKSKWDKVVFEKDGYSVVVSRNLRDKDGNIIEQNKDWVVTAFDNSRGRNSKKRESSSDVTQVTPNTNKGGRAVAPNDNSSESKDTKSKAEGQEKSEESKETSLSEQISTASAEMNTNPTDAQKPNDGSKKKEDSGASENGEGKEEVKPQEELKPKKPKNEKGEESKADGEKGKGEKIEDVGEKIEGARKDALKKLAESMEQATEEALVAMPFSKAFKRPNLKKAVEDGVLRAEDALFAQAVMSAYLSRKKPLMSKSRSNYERERSEKTIKVWAHHAYNGVEKLKKLFSLSPSERDTFMREEMNRPAYDPKDVEKRKQDLMEWNPGKVFNGTCYPINAIRLWNDVCTQLGYEVGTEVPQLFSEVLPTTGYDSYVLVAANGTKFYPARSLNSYNAVVDEIVYQTKVANADADTDHPKETFEVKGSGEMKTKSSGKWYVVTQASLSAKPHKDIFSSKEEAEKFAEAYMKNDGKKVDKYRYASEPKEVKVFDGYGEYAVVLRRKNIGKGTTTDFELKYYNTEAEARVAIDAEHDELNELANKELAKDKGSKSASTKKPICSIEVYTKDGKSWKYGIVLSDKYAPKKSALNTMPYYLAKDFNTRKEAQAYLDAHKEEIEAKAAKVDEARRNFKYFTANGERVGTDYRHGEDVSADQFREQFGFRGVQFGNWTNQRDRQEAINQAFDAFMDLSRLLGVSPRALSLNGELGVAFGARGSGKALAHYEPKEVVINLTKTSGAGSLAHEWWHALDNYFARQGNVAMGFVTQSKNIEMRDELRQAFNTLIDHLEKSPYNQRSKQRGSSYWGTPIEETARMFEQWVNDQLAERGEKSPFLIDADPYIEERYAQMNYEMYKFFMGDKAMPYEEYKQTPQALNGLVYLTRDELQTFGKDLKHIFDTIQQKVDETTGKTLMYHKGGVAVSLNSEEVALRDAVIDRLRENGIDVVTDVSEGQRVLDMANGKERLSGKQKRALETASVSQNEKHQPTVVSSADGAKVLKELDKTKDKYENQSNRSKTFIGDVAKALGARRHGSSSEYATFETKNGKIVTIRLSSHNAKVSNFDNNEEADGISIVVSARQSNGIDNDGNAHITEFYYNAIKLRRADGKPLSEIVRSIKQALYSGEFKDTTGIAERQEVNGDVVREHRVYHGSGADFDSFDHSHMGEGEGAQAYGWGTYVTEVEGIGRTYAISNTTKRNDALRALEHDIDAISGQLDMHRNGLKNDEEQLKRANDWRAEAELDYELFQEKAEERKKEYGEDSPEYRNLLFNDIYTDEMKRAQRSVESTEDSIRYRKEKIAELEKALNDKKAEMNELPEKFPRHLYSVEIPEDNGKNYLDWNERLSDSQIEAIRAYLSDNYRRNKLEDFDASIAEIKDAPNADEVNAWARRGENVYKTLSHLLGSDDAASKALSEMGFAGIKYPAENRSGGRKDGAKNYVIFNENDAKIVDKVRFFRTADSEAYGFVVGGKIYIDPRIASSETSVHEYAHLWAEALRSANAKEWSNVVGLMRGTSVWNEVMERYPELKSDDEIADEVLATYSGRRGSERLREEMDRIKGSERSVADKARALGALERVKRALDRFWHGVADFLGIHYGSADEVADRVMRDLLSGVDPRRFVKGESDGRVREQFVGEMGAERAVELGRELGSDVDVVSDVSEITDANPEVQERKRRAKGWYDAKTGRVVINLAAHSDMADVEQTLLHEIVGHRGLRGLVGHENFNGFLDGIYEHASDDVREGIDDIARRKGCSKRVATEEYMSGLAEAGFADRKNAGLWQQIRQWFGDMLSRAKIKLNFSISDNELRYLLWRSHELSRMNGREGVVGRARDLAMQNRLGVGNGVDLFRTSKQLDAEYGSRWIDEQTNADGRHTTQVKNTVNSYKKFGEWVQQQANGKKVDVLDASSGLGVGTEWLREHGMNVDDVEPYPSENRTAPTYSSYEDIDKRYDYIISNAVLNVIPEDWRADVLHSMADKLKVGGKLVINVRGAESIRNQGTEGQTRITLDDPSEILVLRPNGTIKAYQKGFTKAELKGWCEKELGDGYSVEVANSKNAGGSYDTAVVVTKNDESNTIGVASGATHPSRIVQEVRQPYEDTQDFAQFDSKIKKKSEYVEGLLQLSSKIEQKKFGAHEFLYSIAKAFGFKGNNFNHSMYQDLGGSVGIRISDHSANAENFSERGSTGENYGLVVKLSPHRFRSSENVDYLEYTYYPDKLTQERQKEIVDGLKDFLQTGDYSKLPSPDRVNKSGTFEQESSVDSYDGDLETLFRDADSPVDYERALIRDSYERRLKDVWFQSREALQDGMLSLKETMKDIWRSAGKKFSQITDIPDYANPYIGQNRLSSRNAAEVRDFKHNLFRPLLREVGRLTGFSADGRAKLTDYMMAKHGLERNKVMAERVAKHPNSLTCGP